MRRGFALALAAAIASLVFGLTPKAWAVETRFPCENFQKNEDGSWLVLKNTFMEGPQVVLAEDNVITPGSRLVRGHDLAEEVAKACPNAPVGQTAGAAPTAAMPTIAAPGIAVPAAAAPVPIRPPSASLSRFADANGNIQIDRLTCGHLDDASAEDTDLLLAWYSGSAKRRAINMARLRYEIRNVVDYCKANREKGLVKVMDQMLR
jgi:hypothetical protein